MASYKVAQDVEAEDKLLGPFTFRQFIYLIIAAMAGIVGYGLSRLFVPLFVIPMPIVIFFLILALPLRKDQPMEIYLAAIVSFYLKPRKRLWRPDGVQSLIEITAPTTPEVQRTKNLSGTEAERRLAYLATLADTQGWSIRNATLPAANSPLVSDVYNEASSYQDVFDDSGDIAKSFEDKILKADAARRQAMITGMQQAASAPTQPISAPNTPVAAPTAPQSPGATLPPDEPHSLTYNPYPTSMRQHVISPAGNQTSPTSASSPDATDQPQPTSSQVSDKPQAASNTQQSTSTSDTSVSPDIINLASNTDLSIDTIAREAQRIKQKESRPSSEEVVISLR